VQLKCPGASFICRVQPSEKAGNKHTIRYWLLLSVQRCSWQVPVVESTSVVSMVNSQWDHYDSCCCDWRIQLQTCLCSTFLCVSFAFNSSLLTRHCNGRCLSVCLPFSTWLRASPS